MAVFSEENIVPGAHLLSLRRKMKEALMGGGGIFVAKGGNGRGEEEAGKRILRSIIHCIYLTANVTFGQSPCKCDHL